MSVKIEATGIKEGWEEEDEEGGENNVGDVFVLV